MTLKITFAKKFPAKAKTIILTVFEGAKLSKAAKSFDKDHKAAITAALSVNPQFEGKSGQTLTLNIDTVRIVFLGVGDLKALTALKCEEAGGKLYPILKNLGATHSAILIGEDKGLKAIKSEEIPARICAGLKLRAYTFDRYKAKDDDAGKNPQSITVVTDYAANAKARFNLLDPAIEGTYTARDLVNEPPNHLYPEAYAKFIKDELKPLGVQIEIIDEKKMAKLGMEAILSVGKGSERQPRMVIMRWNGAKKTTSKKKDAQPIALVGKGVTFDTGGISIKPGAGMDEMKMDMGGSAAVVGAMKTLALRKAKANVVGIVGLAENMPSHNAYRPGDIIGSLSGKTIEVLNTDAEGRLVLADCLTHVQRTYKPSAIIDLATLTGAMMVALGNEYCGTFVNDNKLWKCLETASETTGEKLWRMPLDEVWKKDMVSNVADLQNLGKSGRYGGACTAAGFLEHFIENDTPWAHMDIAGTAWRKSDQPTVPKYGSGFGVRVLDQLIADHYEG